MAITYPLSPPTNIGIANIILSADNATAISQSPFTFSQQVIKHQGERWRASVSLPPMKAVDAEYWVAFLLSLRGQYGTFRLGDPNYTSPRGTALTTKKNIFTYTEHFENAVWSKTNITIGADSAVAPDGTVTADKIQETAVTSFFALSANPSASFSTTYTWSCYAKASERNFLTVSFTVVGVAGSYNLTTGQTTAVIGSPAMSATSVGNGWWRCSMRFTTPASGTNILYHIFGPAQAAGVGTYAGTAGYGIYVWGAQLETGSTATSYQGIYDDYNPRVDGSGQTGSSLNIYAASPNQTGYLIAGDYIQLGGGTTATLHKVLTRVDTDDFGKGTVDLWPAIRTAPSNGAGITLANPKGKFRLSSNTTSWEINNISSYGITFDCVEAI